MTRIRLIMYRYNSDLGYAEMDIARQQPDGLKEWPMAGGNNSMFILTLKRGDTIRALRQVWWFIRKDPKFGPVATEKGLTVMEAIVVGAFIGAGAATAIALMVAIARSV